jgi:hypothetical protein
MTLTDIVPALLGSGTFSAVAVLVVRWLIERRTAVAEVRKKEAEAGKAGADLTAVLTGGATELVEQYVDANKALRAELADVKKEMGDRITNLENKLDLVLDVVRQEQDYVRARGLSDAPVLTKLHKLAL